MTKLEDIGIPVDKHFSIEESPNNLHLIIIDNVFVKNDYIKTIPIILLLSILLVLEA